ncbi:beta-ketoacyl-ACP synthase II [candidate division KSB1 bacterium]|nr:beta-ketoacyl-ACP synthase II [candidate division KSB1 bacterium]
MDRRVVVTGMGSVTPVGLNNDELWQSLIKGVSGIFPISKFDTENHTTKFAGEIKNFDILDFIDDRKLARRLDDFTKYAVASASMAIQDSGLDLEKEDRNRIGVISGSGIGGLSTFEREFRKLIESGPRRVSPFFIPMMISDIAPGQISIMYGLKGPNYSTTSACATSAHAIASALRTIQFGEADVMITGGSEASVTSMGIAGFNNMKALSERNDDPQGASRPFDAERDGFVLAEGGGILVLEELGRAKARGAKIYAELCGIGNTADAYHITAPDETGDGATRAMQLALKDAGLGIHDVDYINAHGTSTLYNDKIETMAIKKVFGDHAYNLAISSTKSMMGHMLGAAGSVEAIICIMAIQNSIVPPTINYTTPDPECNLNYTANKAVEREINLALTNSFGFGGHNVCMAIKSYKD